MSRTLSFILAIATIFAVATIVSALFFKIQPLYAAFLPELGQFDNARDRSRAYRKAVSSFHGSAWLSLMVFGVIIVFWIFAARRPAVRDFSNSLIVHMTVFLLVPYPLIVAGFLLLFRGRLRHSLQRQLSQRGNLVCGQCGYDLRGKTEPRWPECGQAMKSAQVAALKEAAGS